MQYFTSLRIQRVSQSKYDVFERAASNAGFIPKKDVIDGVETVYFANSEGKYIFWLAPWDNQWVVFLYGPQVFYRIGKSDQIDGFLLELLEVIANRGARRNVMDNMRESFDLQELSRAEWTIGKRDRIRSEYARMGWNELSDYDWKIAWDKLSRVWDFDNGVCVEPQPCTKWDIRHVIRLLEGTGKQEELTYDLEQKCVRAMRRLGDDFWLALYFNHPSYRLHIHDMSDSLHPWPVSPFPHHDEAFFVSSDFRCGIASRLRSSISVFGQPLLDIFMEDLPNVFLGN